MTLSFRVKLLASHVAVALAVGAVTLLVVERSVSGRMEAQVDSRLESQGHAVARWMERAGHPDRLARRLAGVVGARVTILDATGGAVGESRDVPAGREYLLADDGVTRPEVVAARASRVGKHTRYSELEGEQVRYLAVRADGDLVVRLGLPIGEIDETKSELRRQLGASAFASLLVALGLAALVAGPLTRQLRDATAVARRIGAGDYDVGPPSTATDEVGILSRTLAAAAAELEETELRRREFLANVAHEIRTPVTSIRGYAETLEGTDLDSATRSEFVQTIHRNSVRIGQLVEDLLELEALQAGKGRELGEVKVGIKPVVTHVVETLRARAEAVNGTVNVEVPESLSATGDADAIERVLLNLTDNALRHGGLGNDGVVVDVTASEEGGRVTVIVSDDGPGIPAEQRARVFERFHRGVARGDRSDGSGLGLAIARELAQAMGGSLSVADSEIGARFELELPA